MKKRILSLLLALCLIVGMLPMVVLAEELPTVKRVAFSIGKTSNLLALTNTTFQTAVYKKVTSNGTAISDGTAEDYNIKIFQTAEGLEITFKDATLKQTKDVIGPILHIQFSGNVTIYLLGNNVFDGTGENTASVHGDTMAAIYSEATGTTTITGSGTMTAFNYGWTVSTNWSTKGVAAYNYGETIIVDNDLVIKDTTVTLTQTTAHSNPWTAGTLRCGGNLTIDGATVTLNAPKRYGIQMGSNRSSLNSSGDVTITNGAKVTISSSNYGIAMGTGNLIINNQNGDTCVTINSSTNAFNKTPKLEGLFDAFASATKNDTNAPAYTADPQGGETPSTKQYLHFSCVHTCIPGEPIEEYVESATCAQNKYTVTYCSICQKELNRTGEPVPYTKNHTPGQKTLVKQTNAKLTTDYSDPCTPGTYEWKYTCSVCGDTWTETEEFYPGVLYYQSAAGDHHESTLTTPYYQYGSHWNGNLYSPQYTIQPGTTLYFVTQKGINTNLPTHAYMVPTTDATVIANESWNVKIEYPVGGTPVMTLNNATIINGGGIWWGYAIHTQTAPLKIVVKGTNYIGQTIYTNGGVLNFRTDADVTITGDGTLNLYAIGNCAGIRSMGGNITLDNTNIHLVNTTIGSAGNAVELEKGSLTINGGTFTMGGELSNVGEACHGISAAGDIIIKSGAKVDLTQALSSTDYFMIKAGRNVTISESTLRIACVYLGYTIKYGGTLTLDYVNGFTANSIHANTTIDATTKEYIYPDLTTANVFTDSADVIKNLDRRYLDITPNKAVEKFLGTSIVLKEDLDISFLTSADIATEEVLNSGYAEFVINGDVKNAKTYPLTQVGKFEYNEDDELIGYSVTMPDLAAKEMTSQITVTVYDENHTVLTETKADSVVAYALRQLRSEKYANDTAFKTLLVDMLIYGSMAQTQFMDNSVLTFADMPTAALTATEWAYATADEKVTVEKKAATVAQGTGYLGTTFELKSNIGMAIALDATALPDVDYAKVTYKDYYADAEITETISTKDLSSTELYTIFVFDELVAANGRQDVTWTFYNANDEVVLEVTDSLANYVGRMREAYPYMDELLKYCDSANAYFKQN